ncbi:hypothetical protein [Bacillus sp. CHD6a]|uniref:hypothetical protein n=1 Tax=Bacillus sp. CHD6a TaxID=1643452 RepID=UPI0006CE2B39|nr:hypothetical protein [Bacillus sp. CHD6a]KPB06017.1 hypothetical protein AAV98_03605 [Bacillus sp. CHD6a]
MQLYLMVSRLVRIDLTKLMERHYWKNGILMFGKKLIAGFRSWRISYRLCHESAPNYLNLCYTIFYVI